MINTVNTSTGKIYYDEDRRLEFLSVGDYGASANIKADFLGHTKKIYGVEHTEIDLRDKWVTTISTQKGCCMNCDFCDVPKYGFWGNVSTEELQYQIETILQNETITETERFNVHYARMGEPTFNPNVISFTVENLRNVILSHVNAKTIHPVISTMLPAGNRNLTKFLMAWCEVKNEHYQGEAGLQFSINTTNDKIRMEQMRGKTLPLREISLLADALPNPIGRKYTLNFAVTKNTELDARMLTRLFDPKKFIVKLTPIHKTASAMENKYDTGNTYTSFDVYEKYESPLLAEGWEVITFVPSAQEDADRITCGNALIAARKGE